VNNDSESGEASLSDGISLGLGAGYRFNKYFRTDLELSRRAYELQNLVPSAGSKTRPLKGEAELYSAMLNGYLDVPLADWTDHESAGITPYVGGGIGVGLLRANDVAVFNSKTNLNEGSNFSKTYSGSVLVPIAQISAGLTIPIADQVDIDLGYRYFLLGDLSGTRRGQKGESDIFKAHSALAGIRYNFK
jgi:opacity protein-like surface antigen|tara:strand:+ start:473 stop:1042 length:570 start_codon:yes stop_codon:yes gene_type:complete